MKFTSAIFDFNGTLFFDSDYHFKAWKKLVKEEFNHELTEVEMNTIIHGCPNIEAIERLAPNAYSLDKKNELSKLKEAMYREICASIDHISLVDGAPELMNYLKENNIPLTIASASIIENIDFFYTTFHLDQWMKLEDIIYDNGTYKNKIAMFNDALSILGKEKESCIIFEDSLSGVLSAIEAGFKHIILLHQHQYREDFDKYPEILFHSNNFYDVLNYIKSN
ncbi:HAD family hydrolase [Anaerorhabdus furcosa]|uniref:Haloacid dehalogenase superfamily, subfamily IA, variant 3 with third motif having DD or ED n=1 Tax=Anaerorhabdus furcosa TaxID=118967 RepID=A0A1T4MEB0_9FIRM|nr:HAD family phosphatase [Anaerorhabdus furcosa]SJZ65196.1 haloacid dehalogenase superfamily, subfamily IA, variant 3 with third motif having DD or ED [Anaerorhabdus furcosa]